MPYLNLHHQGGKRDARQAPADEYKEPEANYEAPADSYQEPDPSYSVPTVPPVNTGYVNPQAPTDKPVSLWNKPGPSSCGFGKKTGFFFAKSWISTKKPRIQGALNGHPLKSMILVHEQLKSSCLVKPYGEAPGMPGSIHAQRDRARNALLCRVFIKNLFMAHYIGRVKWCSLCNVKKLPFWDKI